MASSPILTDSFADSVISTRGPRWTKPTRYWPTLLWNTGTTEPSGFNISPVECELHDKYREASGVAAGRAYLGPFLVRKTTCFTHRLHQAEDQIVSAGFKLVDVVGGQQDYYKSNVYAGVGARVTGETGTEFDSGSGYSEMLVAPSGYFFWFLSRYSGGHGIIKFALHKVDGPGTAGSTSTITELDTEVWVTGPYTEDEILAGDSFGLRMSCVTNGGVVELRGYYTDPDGNEQLVVSYDEGTGGLTESGHAMFATTSEMVDPSGVSDHGFVLGATHFQIQDSAGTLVMRDEFDRVNLNSCRRAGPDMFWNTGETETGQILTGMFTGDQSGESQTGELPDFGDRLVRHPSIAKLDVDHDPVGGHHLFLQPPSNPYSQAVSITADFGAGGSGYNRIAGVCLRRSLGENNPHEQLTSGTDSTGYNVAVHYAGGVWALRVHRYLGDTWEVLGYRVLNQSGDPVSVAIGTAWTLRVDIANRDGQSTATGNVHLDIKLDSQRLTGWTFLVDGMVEESDGSLTDISSQRVLSGGATGFFANNIEGGTGGGEIFIESASQIDVALDVNETEQPSTFMPGEKDGKFGTLTVPHEWPVETTRIDYSVPKDLDSSHVHRHRDGSAQRREWRIGSSAATLSEVSALRQFFIDHEGAVHPFDWTTPEGETVVAAMKEHGLSISKVDVGVYDFQVVIQERLGTDQEVSFPGFAPSNTPFTGGGIEIVDDPIGAGPRYPVFHFEDSYGQFTVEVSLASSALGGEKVYIDLAGTAVEGTHYTNDSNPGSAQVVLEAEEGDTSLSFTLTPIATGNWHPEKRIVATINSSLTGVPVHELDNKLHIYLRSTTDPPVIEFASASQSVAAGATAQFDVVKATGTPSHESNINLYLEIDPTSTAVEGVDYDWFVGAGDAYGLYTISPVASSRTVRIKVLSSATTGRTIKVNLRHEPSDRSEKNLWTISRTLEIQQNENTLKIYPGDPGDNAPGPGGILPPNPLDTWLSDATEQSDPHGNPVTYLKLRDVARGAGYHRKDFQGQVSCGAPHDGEGGGMISMPRYTRVSMFVMQARVNGALQPFPRFFRLGVRDRGFSLSPPQVFNATGLGEVNYGVIFDSQASGTGLPTDSDGHTWDTYATTSNWPTGGEYGIDVQSIRWKDGTVRDVARLWIIYREQDVLRLGHAMVRIWYPIYFGAETAGSGENLENNKGKAVAVFWPYLETSNSLLTGAPGEYHERNGFFDGPLGNAVRDSSGITQHTITVS